VSVGPMIEYKYDVALSYATEDREYVRAAADALSRSVKVFFDEYEREDLWGTNLYRRLGEIFNTQARYAVIFISRHYSQKAWTNLELDFAQSRSLVENGGYILPARFDGTVLPSLLSTVGYLDLRGMTPVEFAAVLERKIRNHTHARDSGGEFTEISKALEDMLTWMEILDARPRYCYRRTASSRAQRGTCQASRMC
jgi:hypothetical protein